jgi:hypothetical protein
MTQDFLIPSTMQEIFHPYWEYSAIDQFVKASGRVQKPARWYWRQFGIYRRNHYGLYNIVWCHWKSWWSRKGLYLLHNICKKPLCLQLFMAVSEQITVFWIVIPCNLVSGYQPFGVIWLHPCFFSVVIYLQIALCYSPEDHSLSRHSVCWKKFWGLHRLNISIITLFLIFSGQG